MPRCPNCNYELVLLAHRRKYKCAKCGKLFWQREVEIKEFQKFNKQERQNDKEAMTEKKGKQKPLTDFEKKENSRACQRKFREENREGYNQTKREYWASNHEHLLQKRRENYQKQKAKTLAQQALYRQNHKIERRINNLRFEQKDFALKILENKLNILFLK